MFDDFRTLRIIKKIRDGGTGSLSKSQIVVDVINLQDFCEGMTEDETNDIVFLYEQYRSDTDKKTYDMDSLYKECLKIEREFNEIKVCNLLSNYFIDKALSITATNTYTQKLMTDTLSIDLGVAIYANFVEYLSFYNKKGVTIDLGENALWKFFNKTKLTDDFKQYQVDTFRKVCSELGYTRPYYKKAGYDEENVYDGKVWTLTSILIDLLVVCPEASEELAEEMNAEYALQEAELFFKNGYNDKSDLQMLVLTLAKDVYKSFKEFY